MQPPITYADHMQNLNDEKTAKDFLKQMIDMGFTIDNYDKPGIDDLPAMEAIKLSMEVWPIYYLESINFAGQIVQ